MINKKILFGMFLIILLMGFTSAVCCEKIAKGVDLNPDVPGVQGGWCQVADDEGFCDKSYDTFKTETCSELDVPECHGTCIKENSYQCGENTPKWECKDEFGGDWTDSPIDEVEECQNVCCVLGAEVAFSTPTGCKEIFTDFDIKGGIIRDDITDSDSCYALGNSFEEGACVIETEFEKICKRTIESGCTVEKIFDFAQEHLQYAFSEGGINTDFERGKLCTASGLSDCARSKNTICKDNKVYFTDTCGNTANVYDVAKFGDDAESVDYWSNIKNPYEEEVCQIDSPSSMCGNCDTVLSSTVCQSESEGKNVGTAKFGDYVCGDLRCTDLNVPEIKAFQKEYERYPKHGESWCGGIGSVLAGIEINWSTGEISQSSRSLLEDVDKYNTPGSRYYMITCSFGELTVEECSDYRNQVCMQGYDETSEKEKAFCEFNTWRTCFELETKSQCEDSTLLCKWVPGYRWDLEIVDEKDEGLRDELQGSCVPLVAPGFDFWEADSQGVGICSVATIQEYALFETHWTTNRENFAGWSTKTRSHACLNGCYSIPNYGIEFTDDVTVKICDDDSECRGGVCFAGYCVEKKLYDFYDESETSLGSNVENYHVSDRRGQYCHKKGEEDNWLSGQVSGDSYDCSIGSEDKEEEKERDFPLFLTHESWLDSLVEKSRSLGDCGYKFNNEEVYSDSSTELITAIFQKLSQKGEIKEEVVAEQIIYEGAEDGLNWVGDETKPYNEQIYQMKEYTCSEQGGFCIKSDVAETSCSGEINEDASCPNQMVCCINPELE